MLKVDKRTGLCEQAVYIQSPNQDARPEAIEPELVVVHGISLPPNRFGGEAITQLFTNRLDPKEDPYFATIAELRVSAHALIRRDGSLIQYVPFHRRAWHAGLSSYRGRSRCNDFSIGIELEGTDCGAYSASQYTTLAALIVALWRAYPSLPHEAVVGHSEIAPGRKTDPGAYFQWQALWRLLEKDAKV